MVRSNVAGLKNALETELERDISTRAVRMKMNAKTMEIHIVTQTIVFRRASLARHGAIARQRRRQHRRPFRRWCLGR